MAQIKTPIVFALRGEAVNLPYSGAAGPFYGNLGTVSGVILKIIIVDSPLWCKILILKYSHGPSHASGCPTTKFGAALSKPPHLVARLMHGARGGLTRTEVA